MSPPTRPRPSDRAARAFARVGLPNLVVKLYRYANVTLQLAAIDADRADVVEASDLVNTLVVKGLDGTLIWILREDATDDQIVGSAWPRPPVAPSGIPPSPPGGHHPKSGGATPMPRLSPMVSRPRSLAPDVQ